MVQTWSVTIDAKGSDDEPQWLLLDSVLVVGDAGMPVARSLADIGYDVRLAQLRADESLEDVWRSDRHGVTIDLEDHPVEEVGMVYVAEPVEKFIRLVRMARQIGAAVVWSPFGDPDGSHRRMVEGAGLVFVTDQDIVVLARRHRRQQAGRRLEIIDAQMLAHEHWAMLGDLVADAADRPAASAAIQSTLGVTEFAAQTMIDQPLSRRTRQAFDDLTTERAELRELLES